MRKTIKFQTRERVRQLLDKKHGKANLQKLKRARYMREAYNRDKKRLTVTLTPADFECIQTAASTAGLTPTTFLRDAALAYLANERVVSQSAENSLSQAIFLWRNIANNLNQIAKQSNTLQKLTFGDFVRAKSLLRTLEDTAIQAIKRLS